MDENIAVKSDRPAQKEVPGDFFGTFLCLDYKSDRISFRKLLFSYRISHRKLLISHRIS